MFAIADCRHTVPSYLRNVGADEKGYVTVSLSDAIIFKSRREANAVFEKIKRDGMFEFGIYELGVIR